MDKILRLAFVFASAAFFAVMWGLLLRSRLPVDARQVVRPDYSRLLAAGETERTSEWDVCFAGRRVGNCMMTARPDESGLITVEAQTVIDVPPLMAGIFGGAGSLEAQFRAGVSPLRGLQNFEFRSQRLGTLLRGAVSENEMALNGSVGNSPFSARLPFDQDRFLASALSPMAALPELNRAAVGVGWTLDILNPLAGGVEHVAVTVDGFKPIVLNGEKTDAFRLRFVARANRWVSWVSQDGTVLVQGTPFGLTLRRADLPAELLSELDAAE